MHSPRRVRRGRAPRHRGAERVIDLERGRIPTETGHLDPHTRRQFVEGDQSTIKVLGGDIGQNGTTDPDKLIMHLDAGRTPMRDSDLGHLRVAYHRTSARDDAIPHGL